jgi:hypothetical protein
VIFDTFDRTGAVESPFTPEVVFRAVEAAVRGTSGMSIEEANPLAGHLSVKTSVSAFSWGEKVLVSVLDAGSGRSRVQIGSAAKTIMGSATTHGKNRKNVQRIISATSKVLEQHGSEWSLASPEEVETGGHAVAPEVDSEARLRKLDSLRGKSLVTEDKYAARKAEILSEL